MIELVDVFEGAVIDVGFDELSIAVNGEPEGAPLLPPIARTFAIFVASKMSRPEGSSNFTHWRWTSTLGGSTRSCTARATSRCA